jgi:flagellar hook-basal body complex protein FliE
VGDPVGLIGGAGGVRPTPQPNPASTGPAKDPGAPNFRDVLMNNLEQVNAAQQEADRAVEDLVSGRRSDVEGVILATQKADTAFKMLQSVRGKVMAAYDEIKQVRV